MVTDFWHELAKIGIPPSFCALALHNKYQYCWVNYGKIFIIYIGKFNSSNITNLFAREPQRAWAAADIRVSPVLLL